MFSQHLILLTHKKKAHSITWVGNTRVTKGKVSAPERAFNTAKVNNRGRSAKSRPFFLLSVEIDEVGTAQYLLNLGGG